MKEPIKSGDECLVIGGMGRHKSPNLGIKVKVVSFQGEHSQHGKIWRCSSPDLKQMKDDGSYQQLGWADLAESWLQKDNPPPLKKVETKKELENA